MKKLFTLVALLTCFLGAKAEWVEDYKIDYSTYNGFPFYVMGYVPEFIDGVMTDFGAMYTYKTEAEEGDNVVGEVKTNNGAATYQKILLESAGWHQYFIADGIPTELDGTYTVIAMVKASESVNVNVNMGWGWGDGQQAGATVNIGTDWQEVEWSYTGIGGTSCNLVAQPGTSTATIEWKWLKVSHNQKEQRPVTWQEWLTSDGQPVIVETTSAAIPTWMGNAETPWADPNTRFDDAEKNYLICAWSKEKGRNMNDNETPGWDPFPADIENVDGSNVFVCHGQPATTEGDASAWDNQFWIQSPKAWKSGDVVKIHFRYKASAPVSSTDTQIHYQTPSNYLIWHAIGNIAFTEEWQEFDGQMTFADDMAGGWSIAFNLNSVVKDAVTFYFDDLSWQSMKLDEGYFVAGSNPDTGLEYDFDNADEFEYDEVAGVLTATVGEAGNKSSYVSQIMISTVRGNDAAFKSNTLKPSGTITNDPDNWMDYTASSLAKLTLPGSGVWKIYLDVEYGAMAFEMIEGEIKEPINVVTNSTPIVVHGLERDWLTAGSDGNPREAEVGTGETWDNQFFFVANRELEAGEVTVLKFKYKASKEAKTTTQCHAAPGAYIHWGAIGDVNFTTEWQNFEQTFTIPSECAGKGMKSIAFNMAEIKEACDYEITDVEWYLQYDEEGKTWENLINATGSTNFYVKEGAGTNPHEFEGGAGINNVVNNKTNSAVIYNIAGQRVSKDYKGLVVKDGKKYVVK